MKTNDTILSYKMVALHCFLGLVAAQIPYFAFIWGIAALLFGMYDISQNKNRNNEAAIWCAYYVSMEITLRICKGYLSFEFAKYMVVIFLVYGAYVERKMKNVAWVSWTLFLCVPAMLYTLTWSERPRQDILFNISGLLSLCAASFYFYKREIAWENMKNILFFILLPIISLSVIVFYKTPQLSLLEFTTTANFDTSGGYGPNQVATILGLGWLLILVLYLCREKVTKSAILDFALFAFILYRALFTFSRGGNYTSVIALALFIAVQFVYGKKLFTLKSVVIFILFFACSLMMMSALNKNTNGMFGYRFEGKNKSGELKEDITSNRMNILENELALFEKNIILGVGIGGSRHQREQLFNEHQNTHNEFGRLLSEQGVMGGIIILILIIIPIRKFINDKNAFSRSLGCVFIVVAVATMFHSAMRISIPGFLYGLGLSILSSSPSFMNRK